MTSERPLQPPKAANLTGLRHIGANFNEHTIGYVHYLLGCKCYSLSNSTHIWHFLSTHILLTPYNRQNAGRNPWQQPVWSPKEALSAVAHRLQHKHDDRQHRNHADSRPREHVPYAAVAVGTHNVAISRDNHLEYQDYGQQHAVDDLRGHHNLEQVDARHKHQRYR